MPEQASPRTRGAETGATPLEWREATKASRSRLGTCSPPTHGRGSRACRCSRAVRCGVGRGTHADTIEHEDDRASRHEGFLRPVHARDALRSP